MQNDETFLRRNRHVQFTSSVNESAIIAQFTNETQNQETEIDDQDAPKVIIR